MKYADFIIDGKNIEFHNSILGKETIKIDNIIVSEKYSMFGTKHLFGLSSGDYELISSLQFFSRAFVILDLYKDDVVIDQVRVTKKWYSPLLAAFAGFSVYFIIRLIDSLL